MSKINPSLQARTLCNYYEKSIAFENKSNNTKLKYRGYLNRFRAWCHTRTYENIKGVEIENDFLYPMRKTPTQHNNCVSFLKMLCQWGIAKGHVRENIMANVSKMKIERKNQPVFTSENFEQIKKKYAIDSQEYLAASILYYTGMRQGDLNQLSNDNFQDGMLRFTCQKNNQLVVMPIPQQLLPVLEYWRDYDGIFLPNRAGERMNSAQFSNWFARRTKKAGFSKSAHTCRRGYVTNLVDRGASSAQIQSHTGHKTDQMINLYSKQRDRELLAKEASKLVDW